MARKLFQMLNEAGQLKKVRRNFRGRGGSRLVLEVVTDFPAKKFIREIINSEKRWLQYAGLVALNKYKEMVGTKAPKMLTKKYNITQAYKKAYEQGNRHPYPYKRIGTLRSYSNFIVDMSIGDVVVGPKLLKQRSDRVVSPKTVPQLLNEGGPAVASVPQYKKVTISDRRKGRGRRKTKKYFYQKTGTIRQNVQFRSFNFTKDLRKFAVEKLMQKLQRDYIGG